MVLGSWFWFFPRHRWACPSVGCSSPGRAPCPFPPPLGLSQRGAAPRQRALFAGRGASRRRPRRDRCWRRSKRSTGTSRRAPSWRAGLRFLGGLRGRSVTQGCAAPWADLGLSRLGLTVRNPQREPRTRRTKNQEPEPRTKNTLLLQPLRAMFPRPKCAGFAFPRRLSGGPKRRDLRPAGEEPTKLAS